MLELGESKKGKEFVGELHILKSAWRNTLEEAESEVYDLITKLRLEEEVEVAKKKEESAARISEPTSLGIALSLYGGDVFYSSDSQTLMVKSCSIPGVTLAMNCNAD